jgi:hypothetical protein
MGALGNIYYYMRTLCNNNSIIVNADADDALVGAQTFNLFNKLYQNPEVWYVYSNFIKMKNPSEQPIQGNSRNFTSNVSDHRKYLNLWITSHLKSFRY